MSHWLAVEWCRSQFDQDKAFERRFVIVELSEPTEVAWEELWQWIFLEGFLLCQLYLRDDSNLMKNVIAHHGRPYFAVWSPKLGETRVKSACCYTNTAEEAINEGCQFWDPAISHQLVTIGIPMKHWDYTMLTTYQGTNWYRISYIHSIFVLCLNKGVLRADPTLWVTSIYGYGSKS